MKNKAITRRITSFERRFGKPHLYLAYHAAFPLALTPELLYRLWANFQQDIDGHVLNVPWEAVSDILLSNLCEEVGNELYEMDTAVRCELLRMLKQDEKFGQPRIIRLSDFLLEYVQQQLNSDDIDIRDFAKAQQWTALAYTKPSEVARQVAQAFGKLEVVASASKQTNQAELIRMATLVETFAEPLAEAHLEPLLVYARGMASFARGDLDDATEQLEKVTEKGKIEIAGVDLPIPELVKENIDGATIPKGQNFSRQILRGKSFKGQDLTGADFSYTDIRSTDFTDAKLIGANFSYAITGLQRRWATVLMVCSFLLSALAGAGSALLGFFLGGFSGQILDSNPGKTFNTSNHIFVTGMIALVVFAIVYLANIRQPRIAISTALISVAISLPLSVGIAALIIASLEQNLLYTSYNFISLACSLIASITFAIDCFLSFRRGFRAFWTAAALALTGACCYTISLTFNIYNFTGSTQNQDTFRNLTLIIGLIAVVCFSLLLFIRAKTQNINNRRLIINIVAILLSIGSMLSIIVSVNQNLGGITFSLVISWITISLALALVLVWFSSHYKGLRLRQVLNAIAISTIFVVIITCSSWLLVGFSFPSQLYILFAVVIFTVVGSTALTLSGIANWSGSVAGIITLCVTSAIIFASVLSRDKLLPSVLADIITGAVVIVSSVALARAMIVILVIAIALAWAEAHNVRVAIAWSSIIAGCAAVMMGLSLSTSASPDSMYASFIIGWVSVGIAIIGVGARIAWLALAKQDKRFAFVRDFAIRFAAMGGTSFRSADLTDADFSQATLKSADFRQANLMHTSWLKAKKLDRACIEDSYLQHSQVLDLAITGEGQGKNFDYLDLSGINLRGANLIDASFTYTNLSKASLRSADLSRAKLIHTISRGGDFTGACFTGAYINHWTIASETKLDVVSCQYFYRRFPTEEKPNPLRLPEDNQKNFEPGEFAQMITEQRKRSINPEYIDFPNFNQ